MPNHMLAHVSGVHCHVRASSVSGFAFVYFTVQDCIVGYRVGFPGGSVVRYPPAHAGTMGSVPGLGRSPGGGNGNPLQ